MTIQKLSEYYHTRMEIDKIQNQLKDLEATILSAAPIGNDVKSNEVSRPVEKLIEKKLILEGKLLNKVDRMIEEQIQIEEYLDTVDDPRVRTIIRMRFIEFNTWKTIAKEMYTLSTDSTVPYNQLKAYLNKSTK